MPRMMRTKLLSWGSDVEDGTLDQAARAAQLPFIVNHVALMPDAHIGMGATIGSVIPTVGAIIPAAVGVDIGCGMIAVETSLNASDLPDDLTPLHHSISRSIPAGVGRGHNSNRGYADELIADNENVQKLGLADRAAAQMGTLGSGNHFVEVCLDQVGTVWVVLHSGSRGVGNKLAMRHIKTAKGLMERYFITLDDPDLAYFVEGTREFAEYMTDLHWAQDYALANRETMMDAVLKDLAYVVGWPNQSYEKRRINCHHNYTAKESHCLTCLDSDTLDNASPSASPQKDEILTRVRGFLESCQIGFHSCGGLVLTSKRGDQESLPLLASALAHILSCSPLDDLVEESERSHLREADRPCSCHRNHSATPTSAHSLTSTFLRSVYRQPGALESLIDRSGILQELSFLGVSSLVSPQNDTIQVCDGSHDRSDIWVTRKGAIRARVGDFGVIPGSMGTNSYIVKGLGNKASFDSSAHGAGRRMSRTRARKELSVEDLTARMDGKVWNSSMGKKLLDEHPDSYKDIEDVMADQADLVEIVTELHQVLNFKGA